MTAAAVTRRDREIANLVALKAGKDINRHVFWHYRGYLINVNTGKPVVSIEGVERVAPVQNFPATISPIGLVRQMVGHAGNGSAGRSGGVAVSRRKQKTNAGKACSLDT